jgi:hypothetical protein
LLSWLFLKSVFAGKVILLPNCGVEGGIIMADQTVRLAADHLNTSEIAAELTKALIENGLVLTVEDAVSAYQKMFDAVNFADKNTKNPCG